MSANATLDIEGLTKQLESVFGKKLDEFSAEQKVARDKAIEDALKAFQDNWERKHAVHSLPGSADEKHKGEKFQFRKAIRAAITRNPADAPMEWAMSEELRGYVGTAKAMSFGSDANVGFLVPSEVVQSELVPLLYANLAVDKLGPRKLTGLTRAPIQIPKVTGGTTAYWVGEAATITASDLTAQQVEASPRGLAAVSLVSHLFQLLENSNAESMIREDQAMQLALKWELAMVTGTGSSSQPRGILNWTGVNTAGISTTPTYDELLGAINAVREDNAMQGNLGWLMSNADLFALEKMKDATVGPATPGDGDVNVQPLGTRQWLTGTWPNYRLLGYPVQSTTQLAAGEGPIFGNWSDLLLCQWGGMSFAMTDALGFLTAQTHLRSLMWVDNIVRRAVSFNVG